VSGANASERVSTNSPDLQTGRCDPDTESVEYYHG